ncbi:hypothetical protein [Bacillus sp. FSL K6-3431]
MNFLWVIAISNELIILKSVEATGMEILIIAGSCMCVVVTGNRV